MAFHIVRNYGGVVGLHVAFNVFSEEAEEQLWAIFGVGGAAREEHDGGKYVDLNASPRMFPAGARVAPAPGARCARPWLVRAPAPQSAATATETEPSRAALRRAGSAQLGGA